VRVSATPGQEISRNSKTLSVAPGAPFTASVEMGATARSAESGYVALIFLGKNGNEIERQKVWLQPADAELGKVITDREGRFNLRPASGFPPTSSGIRAQYSGGTDGQETAAIAR
jgi:hypothetical protein